LVKYKAYCLMGFAIFWIIGKVNFSHPRLKF
jgi:hypothetical protein